MPPILQEAFGWECQIFLCPPCISLAIVLVSDMKFVRWVLLAIGEVILVFAFLIFILWLGSPAGLGQTGWIIVLCACVGALGFLSWRVVAGRKRLKGDSEA